MRLPAGQERVLHGIEGALKASEPRLASMFAIFARLNQDEPVGAELLQRSRLRWLRPGTAMSAIVVIPVMSAQPAGPAAGSESTGSARSAAGAQAASGTPGCSCTGPVPAARFTTLNGREQEFSPPARTGTATAQPSGMC